MTSVPSSGPDDLNRILERITRFEPRKVPGRSVLKRAAVAAIMRRAESGDTELLFIRRATAENDPWSGHMAFPGGRAEQADRGLRVTAERETHEEVGLDLSRIARARGRLSDVMASARGRRIPLVISPYVYELQQDAPLTPNYEVAEALWVPLSYFEERKNRSQMDYRVAGMSMKLPCYRYEGRVIWGLTLRMLDELLELIRER